MRRFAFLFSLLFLWRCTSEPSSQAPEKASVVEVQKEVSIDQLRSITLPYAINPFQQLPKECFQITQKELFKGKVITVIDPGSLTENAIKSDLLFETAELFLCQSFPMPGKKKAVILRTQDQALARKGDTYLLILDEKERPLSAIALSYIIETPTSRQQLSATLTPDFKIRIREKTQFYEDSTPNVVYYTYKIDTLTGEILPTR